LGRAPPHRVRGDDLLAPNDALDAHFPHQAGDRAASDIVPGAAQRVPEFLVAVDLMIIFP